MLALDEAPRLLPDLRFIRNYPLDSAAAVALILCGRTERRHLLVLGGGDSPAAETSVTHRLQQVGVDWPTLPECKPHELAARDLPTPQHRAGRRGPPRGR